MYGAGIIIITVILIIMYCMQVPRPISKVIESQILKRIELYYSLNSVYIIHTQNVDTICNHITKPEYKYQYNYY